MPKQIGTLPVGAKIKDTTSKYYNVPLIWQIADKNHSGYPANSVTLITEKIIALKCFDAKEPSNADSNRQNYGNNRYIYANMRRWLNSEAGAGAWYAAQHSADTPPSTANIANGNAYDTQAGFLNAFSSSFKNALLTTTLTVGKNTVTDGGGSETLTDKVFLASNTEVGLANENSIVEGAKLALFSENASRIGTVTAECVANSNYTSNPAAGAAWYWWLRTPYASDSYSARLVYSDGSLNVNSAFIGSIGVRPLCNLLSSILVSDTTDGDGCYTIVWNRPPNPPATINVPETIYSGQNTTVAWSAATDADGDSVSYRLERSTNGGSWTQIYSGSNTSYTDSITTAMNTLQYRVEAVDSYNEPSGYTSSPTRAVIHNLPPVISGIDGNLGVKNDVFSYEYTVTDPESNAITVQEKVDGQLIKTYAAQLGKAETMSVSGTNWVRLTQGSHNLTVTATDTKGGTVTRTMTFTKQVSVITVMLEVPLAATAKPTRINVLVNAVIPVGASFRVEVCNNANDPAPAWEEATEAALTRLAYVFKNTMKQATNWGVNIRVTIERKAAIGECYITGIGGNFE